MVPDVDLLDRIVGRDREAFSLFYDRHAPVVLGLCSRILRDSRDAEEVLQEVFLKVWNDAARFDARRASVKTWLFTIARSRSLDRWRSRKSDEKRMTGEGDSFAEAAGEDPEPASLRKQYVERHLQSLSPKERELIFMAYYEGLTQEEIAARLEEPLGTIKSRVRAALQKLRSSFAGEAARA